MDLIDSGLEVIKDLKRDIKKSITVAERLSNKEYIDAIVRIGKFLEENEPELKRLVTNLEKFNQNFDTLVKIINEFKKD